MALTLKALIAILAGLISSAAFYPIHFWPALFVGLSILYYLNSSSRGDTFRIRFTLNFLFGIGFQILTLNWIGTYVGSYAWLALVLMQAAFFLPLSFSKGPLSFAAAWVTFEFILRSVPFGGFGWSRIGFALTESPFNYLLPRVSIVGIAFVITLSIGLVIEGKAKGLIRSIAIYLLVAVIPVPVVSSGTLDVGLVQGGQELKLDNTFENAESAISKHFLATTKINQGMVDLVIWPENAVMHDPFLRKRTRESFESEISRIKAPILVNANLSDGTNGSVLLGDDANQRYSKRYLTPFGEFIPFRSIVEKISDKAELVTGYIPGKNPYLFKTDSGTFRTLICYELLSDKQARYEMGDSEFIVVQTNNATYYKTWQLDQELAIAQARSAETSRQSVYVSTTGGTSLINERGKIEKSLPKYENGALVGEIQKRSGSTYAVKYGSLLEIGILLLWVGAFITPLNKYIGIKKREKIDFE